MMTDDRFLAEVIAAGGSAAIRMPDELRRPGLLIRKVAFRRADSTAASAE
jgi:hypothetical protein